MFRYTGIYLSNSDVFVGLILNYNAFVFSTQPNASSDRRKNRNDNGLGISRLIIRFSVSARQMKLSDGFAANDVSIREFKLTPVIDEYRCQHPQLVNIRRRINSPSRDCRKRYRYVFKIPQTVNRMMIQFVSGNGNVRR